jgi:hypothetical protein
VTACVGEPISWLRLEQFALGAPDPAITAHLAACPACRGCLDQIRGDAVVLPPLAMPAAPPRRAWRRWWLAPALAAAAAAIALVVVLWPPGERDPGGRIAIKGIGEVTLELVRERAGQIQFDARRFAPSDRWKIVVSCPPAVTAVPLSIDVSVADGLIVDHPLAPAQITCGNRVVVPGAFTITGDRPNRVCARIAVASADTGTACATLVPEVR